MSENDTNAQATSNAPATPQYRYTTEMAQRIEEKWQDIWESEGTFWAANVSGELTDSKGRHADGRQSFFAMDMSPALRAKDYMSVIRWDIWPPMW